MLVDAGRELPALGRVDRGPGHRGAEHPSMVSLSWSGGAEHHRVADRGDRGARRTPAPAWWRSPVAPWSCGRAGSVDVVVSSGPSTIAPASGTPGGRAGADPPLPRPTTMITRPERRSRPRSARARVSSWRRCSPVDRAELRPAGARWRRGGSAPRRTCTRAPRPRTVRADAEHEQRDAGERARRSAGRVTM